MSTFSWEICTWNVPWLPPALGQAVASAPCAGQGALGGFVLQERLWAHMAFRIGSKSFTLDFPCPFLTQFWLLTLRASKIRSCITRQGEAVPRSPGAVQSPCCRSRAPGVRFEFWECSREYPWIFQALNCTWTQGWEAEGSALPSWTQISVGDPRPFLCFLRSLRHSPVPETDGSGSSGILGRKSRDIELEETHNVILR